jgi:hypothetical protein
MTCRVLCAYDESAGSPRAAQRHASRLSAARELQGLAKQLGMPAALALRTLVFIAAADKNLRVQVVRLAVATKLGLQAKHQAGAEPTD